MWRTFHFLGVTTCGLGETKTQIATTLVDTLLMHPPVCQLEMKLHSCSLGPVVIPGQVDEVGVKTFAYKCGMGLVPRLSEGTRLGPGMCEAVNLLGDLL